MSYRSDSWYKSQFFLQVPITHMLLQETESVIIIFDASVVLDVHQLCLTPNDLLNVHKHITVHPPVWKWCLSDKCVTHHVKSSVSLVHLKKVSPLNYLVIESCITNLPYQKYLRFSWHCMLLYHCHYVHVSVSSNYCCTCKAISF